MEKINWEHEFSPDVQEVDPTNVFVPDSVVKVQHEKEFRKKLLNFGVHKLHAEILVLRFFYDMDLRGIAKELHIASPTTVLNQLNKVLADLKDRGFKK